MKKILVIFGTRPEAIKMAPVIKALQKCPNFQTFVCVTSQHRQMLDQVLDIFAIKPDFDLDIMKPNQDLFDITANILHKIKKVLTQVKPDIVLVQGDTTTAFVSALACYYQRIEIAHVEAGLRTYDKYNPFPEEINRKLITSLADIHFAPTELSKSNLLKEHVPAPQMFVVGNSAIDSLLFIKGKIDSGEIKSSVLSKLGLEKTKYILVTAHRRESFGDKLFAICSALKSIVEMHPDVDIVYPVHLNPNVQNPVNKVLAKIPRVHLIAPQDYISFVTLMNSAYFIMTDSGGIQEEAPSLGKPTLVLRNTTERVEAIAAGTAKLVGTDPLTIIHEVEKLLNDKSEYKKYLKNQNPYGNGDTALQIVSILKKELSE